MRLYYLAAFFLVHTAYSKTTTKLIDFDRKETESTPLLLFVAVGTNSLNYMASNVLAMSKNYASISYFFAHYDGPSGKAEYEKHNWYNSHVGNHSCAYVATKPQFIHKELVLGLKLKRDPWLQLFEYFWSPEYIVHLI